MKAIATRSITGILTKGKEYDVERVDNQGNIIVIDDTGLSVGFRTSLELVPESNLPAFLYEDDGRIMIGYRDHIDVTDEWNEYLKNSKHE